ncbi:putative calcium-binding protein CML35 [Wolffia australiana]
MKIFSKYFSASPSPATGSKNREEGENLKKKAKFRSDGLSSTKRSNPDFELVIKLLRRSGGLEEEMLNCACEESINMGDTDGFGSAEELKGAFEVFDLDGDGKISAEELMGIFTTLGDDKCKIEDCRRMISVVAPHGDGFVCFEDFVQMMSCKGLA